LDFFCHVYEPSVFCILVIAVGIGLGMWAGLETKNLWEVGDWVDFSKGWVILEVDFIGYNKGIWIFLMGG
jgi:hypothetical protein